MRLPEDVDSMYIVQGGDFPVGKGNRLSPEAITAVLGRFNEFYPQAVRDLGQTVVPRPLESQDQAAS